MGSGFRVQGLGFRVPRLGVGGSGWVPPPLRSSWLIFEMTLIILVQYLFMETVAGLGGVPKVQPPAEGKFRRFRDEGLEFRA